MLVKNKERGDRMTEGLREVLLSINSAHVEEYGNDSSMGMDLTDVVFDDNDEEVSLTDNDRHYEIKLSSVKKWNWFIGEEGKSLVINLPTKTIEITSINIL